MNNTEIGMGIIRKLFFLVVLFFWIILSVFSKEKQESKSNLQYKNVDELIKISSDKFNASSYQEAVKVALKALTVAEKSNNGLDLAKANLQVGKMHYFNQEPYDNILYYYKKARFHIYANKYDSLKQQINYNIGVVYIEQNAGDSAKFYLKKVFEEKNTFNNSGIISKTYSVLADYYLVQNLNMPLAKMYVEKEEKQAQLSNDYRVKTFALINRWCCSKSKINFHKSLDV